MSSASNALTGDPSARLATMGEILAQITSQRYRYNLTKGFSGWTELPPPQGTELNCQAAATLAKRLAEEQHGLNDLKVISYAAKDGFFVIASAGVNALGTTPPEINTPQLKGWEFDNHYRVQDPHGFNKIYDPIFGTSGNWNPTGILASSPTQTINQNGRFSMMTVYGEKYQVTRGIGVPTAVVILKQAPVDPKYIVDDSKFK